MLPRASNLFVQMTKSRAHPKGAGVRHLFTVSALVLVVMAPTGVRAAAGDLVVCDPPPAGTAVIGPNHSSSPSFDAPDSFFPTKQFTDLRYQLDLYPATAANKASVSASLNWQIVLNDWNLSLRNAVGTTLDSSSGVQPRDPVGEAVDATLKHCSLFTIRVLNHQAVGGVASDSLDPLRLTLETGPVK
jgi:hypothetical protein